jgi:hypothetical protein
MQLNFDYKSNRQIWGKKIRTGIDISPLEHKKLRGNDRMFLE